jgi:pyrroline-5-carboxylate reductase
MKLGFIGGGNMAAAMIGGLHQLGHAELQVVVVERDAARRATLAQDPQVQVLEAADASVCDAQILVLAVKPAELRAACEGLAPLLAACTSAPLLLSIAAGIPTEAVARWSGCQAVVRAMPNTPALIGQGITGLYARPQVTAAQRAAATRVMGAIGEAYWMSDEAQLDVVTAISGSGPGYVFYFIEALQQAAAQMGLEEGPARQFAVQTFVGAAQLALQSSEPVGVLRQRVTSPGGTTAAALARFEQDGVAESIVAGAQAALERSREMARTMG